MQETDHMHALKRPYDLSYMLFELSLGQIQGSVNFDYCLEVAMRHASLYEVDVLAHLEVLNHTNHIALLVEQLGDGDLWQVCHIDLNVQIIEDDLDRNGDLCESVRTKDHCGTFSDAASLSISRVVLQRVLLQWIFETLISEDCIVTGFSCLYIFKVESKLLVGPYPDL